MHLWVTPVEVRIHSYELTLRLADAAQIQIDNVRDEKEQKRGSRVRAIPHPGLGEGGKYHEKADEHPLPTVSFLPLRWQETRTAVKQPCLIS